MIGHAPRSDDERLVDEDVDGALRLALLARAARPLCVVCSALGMTLLKAAQMHDLVAPLLVGYALECVAFGVYPLALRAYELRVVSTVWSAGSVLTSLAVGLLVYDERPTTLSAAGCALVVIGVYLVVQ